MLSLCLLWASSEALGAIAFYSREYTEGQTRVCVYKSYKGVHAITIKSYQVCPTSIEVD